MAMKTEIETSYVEQRPTGPLKIVLKVNDAIAAQGAVPVSAPLGSPVSLKYREKAPFEYNGTIRQVHVRYIAPD